MKNEFENLTFEITTSPKGQWVNNLCPYFIIDADVQAMSTIIGIVERIFYWLYFYIKLPQVFLVKPLLEPMTTLKIYEDISTNIDNNALKNYEENIQ